MLQVPFSFLITASEFPPGPNKVSELIWNRRQTNPKCKEIKMHNQELLFLKLAEIIAVFVTFQTQWQTGGLFCSTASVAVKVALTPTGEGSDHKQKPQNKALKPGLHLFLPPKEMLKSGRKRKKKDGTVFLFSHGQSCFSSDTRLRLSQGANRIYNQGWRKQPGIFGSPRVFFSSVLTA